MGDDLPTDMTFTDLHNKLNDGTNFYDATGVHDSVVRERFEVGLTEAGLTTSNTDEVDTSHVNFVQDFKIAEAFGHDAIKDTYKRASKSWTDAIGASVLERDLNYRLWETYESGDEETAKLYDQLWRQQCDLNAERSEKDPEFARINFRICD
jgi:hypothetical protein